MDLVQTQIRIAAGAKLKDLGLVQENVKVAGVAMQCRVTTEDPSQVRRASLAMDGAPARPGPEGGYCLGLACCVLGWMWLLVGRSGRRCC